MIPIGDTETDIFHPLGDISHASIKPRFETPVIGKNPLRSLLSPNRPGSQLSGVVVTGEAIFLILKERIQRPSLGNQPVPGNADLGSYVT